ncbi:MAG: hypothetical protein HQK54_09565 [Oligoflexales bacterium]|nr:hypothetical protein [Oligoflexales bacterium]
MRINESAPKGAAVHFDAGLNDNDTLSAIAHKPRACAGRACEAVSGFKNPGSAVSESNHLNQLGSASVEDKMFYRYPLTEVRIQGSGSLTPYYNQSAAAGVSSGIFHGSPFNNGPGWSKNPFVVYAGSTGSIANGALPRLENYYSFNWGIRLNAENGEILLQRIDGDHMLNTLFIPPRSGGNAAEYAGALNHLLQGVRRARDGEINNEMIGKKCPELAGTVAYLESVRREVMPPYLSDAQAERSFVDFVLRNEAAQAKH